MRIIHWTGIGLLAMVFGFSPVGANADDGAPDAWITLKTKVAVLNSVGIPGTDINVDTVHGQVTLHGTVVSQEDKERADKAARGIEGVRDVRNLLQIVPPKQEDRIEASDAQIESRVSAALKNADTLKGSSITVQSVNKGTVLLAGKAESLSDHVQALEIARHVRGVRSIHSEITSDDARSDKEVWREYEKLGAKTGPSMSGTTSTNASRSPFAQDSRTSAFAFVCTSNRFQRAMLGFTATKSTRQVGLSFRTASTNARKSSRNCSGLRFCAMSLSPA